MYDEVESGGAAVQRVREAWAAGNDWEARGVSMLVQAGLSVDSMSRDHRLTFPVTNKIHVVGHIDVYAPDEMVEIKSMSGTEYAKWKTSDYMWATGFWPRYAWQVSCYAAADPEKPIRMLVLNRDDPDQYELMHVAPPYSESDVRARVLTVEAQARQFLIPPDCDSPNFPCPFFPQHSDGREYLDDVEDDKGTTDPSLNDRIQFHAENYEHWKALEQSATQEKKKAYDNIIAAVGKKGKFSTRKDWKVTTYERTSTTTNTGKLKDFVKESGREWSEFQKKTKGTLLKVTPPDDPSDTDDGHNNHDNREEVGDAASSA